MKIGILGTGSVGKTLATALSSLGHDVKIGTRDIARTLTVEGGSEPTPFAAWLTASPGITLGTFAQASSHGEIVVLAASGKAALQVLEGAGAENLNGKVLIDISNPLDFSQGMPPTLLVSNTDSLGERIQKAFPEARVVKTLNTVNASLMVNPRALADGDHTIFVSGNDPSAKAQVTGILRDGFGWQDVIDLGDITTARGTEMALPLWVRLYGSFHHPRFAFKVVR